MTLDARTRTHLKAVAAEFQRGLSTDPAEATATWFLSGAINGIALAVKVADGESAEQAVEDLAKSLHKAIQVATPPLKKEEQVTGHEPVHAAPALRAQLRAAIEPLLLEHPEHNRRDEHEQIIGEIVTGVLGVVGA
ncbi:hypothetical protein [Streptomyces sp. bgisy031]|uniref:hypothetical protein n=1 Tax=Streptomyces sp. bgisy031 TaxID=3413772 RepID=UPI003D72E247